VTGGQVQSEVRNQLTLNEVMLPLRQKPRSLVLGHFKKFFIRSTINDTSLTEVIKVLTPPELNIIFCHEEFTTLSSFALHYGVLASKQDFISAHTGVRVLAVIGPSFSVN
jgi:hypothetical protein